MLTNKNKYLFIFGILAVVILIIAMYYFFIPSNESVDNTNLPREYVLSTPGPTDIECFSNEDCENICNDDGCLVSSCVKSQNQEGGKCACFDLCGT